MDDFLSLPRYPFTRTAIEHAPDTPGVYALFEGDELIYLGRAASHEFNIKRCLLEHQDGKHGPCTMKATRYTWEIIAWHAARETELLSAFHKRNGRDPRCNAQAA